jgi:hypothetical protein
MPSPNVPLTTGQIAAKLNWSRARARRWLDALAERDPSILIRLHGRRFTTLLLLRRVCPDVASRIASDRDVDEIRGTQADQGEEIDILASSIGALREKTQESIDALERRLETLEGAGTCRKVPAR